LVTWEGDSFTDAAGVSTGLGDREGTLFTLLERTRRVGEDSTGASDVLEEELLEEELLEEDRRTGV
jgi:hypothetical protein